MSNGIFQQNSPVSAVEVTKSDTVANVFTMLYVGVTGDVKITDQYGNVSTFVGVPAGQYIPVRTSLVWSAGTTATNIVGLG